MKIREVSSSTAYLETSDAMLKCNCAANAIGVTLSVSKSYPGEVTIKKVEGSANAVTITPASGETIDGSSSITLTIENEKKTLVPVDSGWTVIDNINDLPTAAVTLAGEQTLTNKTLTTPVIASLYQDAAGTKEMTIPNTASDTLAAIAATQTLTNKTLTTPVISSIYQDAGETKLMTVPDTASDTLTANAATQTLTNKTITSPTLTLKTGTPVNAVAATGVLTLTGVVIDTETVTIGADVYEFAADAAQSVTGANIAVDIEASATKSQGTLTVDTQPTAADTMTIGAKVYTFTADGTAAADGDIDVGTDLADAKLNIVAAINGTDGINTAHTSVSAAAFATNDCVITALIGGVAGDSIATTETFTAVSNVFDAATLGTTTAGVDCSAANAITALVSAITASDTQGVGAADGAGDTVDLTADTKGVAANSIATTETLANGSFGSATLENGVDGTLGSQWEIRVDGSYIYICVAENTIADANWERAAIASY